MLADHKRLRKAPALVLSDRVQQRYPGLVCDLVEGMFTVTNPTPKPGGLRITRAAAARHGVKLRELAADALARHEDLRMSDPCRTGPAVHRTGPAWRGIAFEDRMATVDFRVGARAHITVDSDVCRSCTTRRA